MAEAVSPKGGPDKVVGIDLGTTNSAVAHLDEERRPTLIPIPGQDEGPGTMPSVVLFDEGGRVVVGAEALRQYLIKPTRTVRWIKRSMGEEHPILIDGQPRTPPEISSLILRTLVDEASRELGLPIRRAIITVPAWFDDKARKATFKAGELAGLQVLKVVNEPVAAAIHYGLDKLTDGQNLMAYDLGGGTFDCSILTYNKGVFDHRMSSGDRKLGGHDWTEALVALAAERLADDFGEDPRIDPFVGQQLYERCEQAKRSLATMTEVLIPCVYSGRGAEVTITRDEFEERTETLLGQTLIWCQDAVDRAGLSWSQIDHLLLVGGSTRLRRVKEALTKIAGRPPITTGLEDTMVALGAAMLTADEARVGRGRRSTLKPIKLKERTHRALGLVTAGSRGEPAFVNTEVIPAQTELPAERTRDDLVTMAANQEYFDVAVLQGEERDAKLNEINFTYRFRCLPGTPAGSPIAVTFAYDVSNQIGVKARDGRTGQVLEGTATQFQWPEAGGGGGEVDVVFVLDCTGSMAGCIAGVKQGIGAFCDDLRGSALDYRLALVEYRDLKIGEPSHVYPWTTDVEQFRGWVSGLRADGGGDEPESALDALMEGAALEARLGANHLLVLITDASTHDPDQRRRGSGEVASLLAQRGVRVFAIAPRLPAYERCVNETGGKLFDFNASFSPGRVDVELFRRVLSDLGHAVIRSLLAVRASTTSGGA